MVDKALIIISVCALGALCITLLAYARKKYKVIEAKRIDELTALLPNANCGRCGNPRCRGLAQKLLKGNASPDSCVSGGEIIYLRVAKYLGVEKGRDMKQY